MQSFRPPLVTAAKALLSATTDLLSASDSDDCPEITAHALVDLSAQAHDLLVHTLRFIQSTAPTRSAGPH